MPAQLAASFLCPACQTPLPAPNDGAVSLHCPACAIEVDAGRLETLVGKPRFVAERSWTGTVIDGIVVGDRIGAGGMGTVYRARHENDAADSLAVKFLAPSLAAEPELVTRFWREVALLEKLDHPGIVKVKAHGQIQDVPWFAMELVEGPTLAARLGKGPLALGEARAVFGRLLAALAHAHARGVIHRDLKPANVLLASDGARLADFGIARLDIEAGTHKTQLTRTDAIIGTFSYMAPEQRAGKPADARSDLYALGVMVYEALAGERPEGAFLPLRQRRPELSARLDDVLLRMLRPNPAHRFTSATEVERALNAAWSPRSPVAKRLAYLASAMVGAGIAGWFLLSPARGPEFIKSTSPATPAKVLSEPKLAEAASSAPVPQAPRPPEPQAQVKQANPLTENADVIRQVGISRKGMARQPAARTSKKGGGKPEAAPAAKSKFLNTQNVNGGETNALFENLGKSEPPSFPPVLQEKLHQAPQQAPAQAQQATQAAPQSDSAPPPAIQNPPQSKAAEKNLKPTRKLSPKSSGGKSGFDDDLLGPSRR